MGFCWVVGYALFFSRWDEGAIARSQLTDTITLGVSEGGAFGVDWVRVQLFYHPPHLRLVEKNIYRETLGEDEICNEATVHIEADHIAHLVHVRCGEPKTVFNEDVKMP